MKLDNNLKFLIFNFLGLQVTWAACAYGATHANPMLGFYVGFSYIILHFIFSHMRKRDLIIMIIIGSLGIIIDSTFANMDVISFPHLSTTFLQTPIWLACLWFVFALMIPYSLYWLKKNLAIASIAGAIGGSFSYFLGHKLGALQLAEPLITNLGIYCIAWGIIFPLALKLVELFTNSQNVSEISTS